MDIKSLIRNIPDFPKEGILFRDIMPLIGDAEGLSSAVKQIVGGYRDTKVDKVIAAEARGFILGPAIAIELGCGFAAARKKGKLPWKTRCVSYDLEYGTDTICIHEDAVKPGERVLVHDDLLATGGTAAGIVKLVREAGAEVIGAAFLVELAFLNGRDKLPGISVTSLIVYDE